MSVNPLAKPIRGIVVTEVFTVPQEAAVIEAVEKMLEKDVGCVIICQGKWPTGILTERDVLRKVTAKSTDPRKFRVKDAMSSNLVVATMEMPVGEAAEKMINNRIKRLVVVGAAGELIGLLTMTDIIKWLAEQKEHSDSILHYVQGNID